MSAPAYNDDADVQVVIKTLPKQDETENHQESSDVGHEEAHLRLEDALVTSDVAFSEEVVGKVQEAQLSIVVSISSVCDGSCKEDGGRDVDSNGPSETDEAIIPLVKRTLTQGYAGVVELTS